MPTLSEVSSPLVVSAPAVDSHARVGSARQMPNALPSGEPDGGRVGVCSGVAKAQ